MLLEGLSQAFEHDQAGHMIEATHLKNEPWEKTKRECSLDDPQSFPPFSLLLNLLSLFNIGRIVLCQDTRGSIIYVKDYETIFFITTSKTLSPWPQASFVVPGRQ